MAFNLSKLTVLITANSRQLRGELKKVDGSMMKLRRTAGVVGTAIGAAIGAAGLAKFTELRDVNDEIGHLAEQLNVSATDLQELLFVTKNINVPFRTFITGLQRVTRRAGEAANGSKLMADNFKRMGLDLEGFLALDATGRVAALAEAMKRAKTDGRELSDIFKLLDTEGVALNRLATMGAAGVLELADVSRKAGMVNEKLITASQKSKGAWAKWTEEITGVWVRLWDNAENGWGMWGDAINENAIKPMGELARKARVAAIAQDVLVKGIEKVTKVGKVGMGREFNARTDFAGNTGSVKARKAQEVKSKQIDATNKKLDTLIRIARNPSTGHAVVFQG